MTWRSPSRRLAAGLALLFLGLGAAPPAAAQISLGSPGDPPRLALGGGAFNVIVNTGKPNGGNATPMLWSEYRFGDVWWIISPFVGVQGTNEGAFYGYFGFAFDIHLSRHLVVTPNGAFGYFSSGHGINLGSIWEFKTGAEFAYRFDDQRRIGIGFYHISNAGIGKTDPGQEQATLAFTVPF